jgi:hypothetical protein
MTTARLESFDSNQHIDKLLREVLNDGGGGA